MACSGVKYSIELNHVSASSGVAIATTHSLELTAPFPAKHLGSLSGHPRHTRLLFCNQSQLRANGSEV